MAKKDKKHPGLALGHKAAKAAADACGDAWKAEAYAAFVKYAKKHRFVTTEEVRRANPNIVTPGDLRAWGHIAKAARAAGVVKSRSWVRASSATVHGMVITQWESLICKAN